MKILDGYFYWFGVVVNGLLLLGFLGSAAFGIVEWIRELKDDRYFRRDKK